MLSQLVCLLLISATLQCAASAKQTEPQEASVIEIADAQIGFNGAFKLGCWTPLSIDIQGGSQPWSGRVRVTVPDTDGIPTHVDQPTTVAENALTTIRMFVRVGQASAPIAVSLVSDEGKVESNRSFFLGARRVQGVPGGYPATNRLLLELGGSLGLEQVLLPDETEDEQLATRVTQFDQAVSLPEKWYGYESFETVVLPTSNLKFFEPLSHDELRIPALEAWIQRGGRLVLLCGANAEQLLSEDGLLARFAPGRFEKMERLTQPQPLAIYSGSDQISNIRRINLPVPSLIDVDGQILASAGRSLTTAPLVVRSRRGLGEVVFVGLDFDQPPLSEWEGRSAFLRRLLRWKSTDTDRQADDQTDATDLTLHLRNSLDKQFVGVQLIPFGVVAFLAGAYILLIGPGDFFFVRRVVSRPTLTWLTFPLVVLGVSVFAYVMANRMKGHQLRVNQVEIVDVDCSQGQPSNSLARGTVYTHFFTPDVAAYDLQLVPSFLGSDVPGEHTQLVSWLGLPGFSLGGMQASGSQTSVFDEGYQYDEDLRAMENLPVQVWSTKTLTARWNAFVEPKVEIELNRDGEELVQGTIVNNSDVELTDCALLYGRWAYRIGTLRPGKSIEVNDSLRPRTVKTLLTNATAGDEPALRTSEDGTVTFLVAKWDVARLLKVMMFYDALDGENYTDMVHRYQSFLDLSDILPHDDKAILLARCDSSASQWQTPDDALASDQDRRWTYYRFVASVEDQDDQ